MNTTRSIVGRPYTTSVVVAIAFAALVLARTAAHAQATPPDTAKPLRVTAGIAYLDASGNTDVTTLSANERLEWKRPHFLWTQFLNAINSTTGGEKSAELFATGVRGDWKPGGRLSVYALVNFDRDRFANIDQRFEEGLGLGYAFVERPKHRLTTELGAQYVQQRNLEDVSNNFLAGRAAELYRYTFRENAYFEERVEYLPNLETSKVREVATPRDSAQGHHVGTPLFELAPPNARTTASMVRRAWSRPSRDGCRSRWGTSCGSTIFRSRASRRRIDSSRRGCRSRSDYRLPQCVNHRRDR